MTIALDVSRRKFLAGSAAVAGGLSLGFHIPFEALAQEAAPEVTRAEMTLVDSFGLASVPEPA